LTNLDKILRDFQRNKQDTAESLDQKRDLKAEHRRRGLNKRGGSRNKSRNFNGVHLRVSIKIPANLVSNVWTAKPGLMNGVHKSEWEGKRRAKELKYTEY